MDDTKPARKTAKELSASGEPFKDSKQMKEFLAAVMRDHMAGLVSTQEAAQACATAGRLLKTVEMEYKHGSGPDRTFPIL